ncbi:biopolymer transporter ExbD [Fulvivirga kasyanovii]|uniref:Biopolymer transporter ExbD n=2 Tax=Fulvivirga TaxID=396811 RepID=A0A937G0K7_9BACT|nr:MULTISPECIES: biopolymer transporter ExbD [Fulvivirga]MBL6448318.1 biopolymer transporter ExbD [Fulvivirga marina]MTI28045.1 biopolymer transporter ExbD [Fulvivirga kasyanovii]
MSKFKKKANTKQEIPTSALPDIIFMLLFFFMVTTVLREVTINVKQRIPDATQLRKLQRKSLVSYLYIGEPKKTSQWGSEPRIQANDVFIEPKDVVLWVNQEKDKLDEVERDQITIAMKVDKEAKRGLVSDVEFQLRKANARKLLYTTLQEMEE